MNGMNNWRMIGNAEIITFLKEQIQRGSPRQAYLFTGVEGVGRHTLALRLTQTLNCPNPTAPAEPCGVCQTCIQIERRQYPDLYVVEAEQSSPKGIPDIDSPGDVERAQSAQAEEGSHKIVVDQVRALQHWLSLAPYHGRFRVAILLNFEDATESAANALLKTLEEPPPRAILILTAESEEALLPTIVSRCEVLRLQPAPTSIVNQGLMELYGLTSEEANLLAHLSGGRPGYAIWLHQHPEHQRQRKAMLEEFIQMLYSNRFKRVALALQLCPKKELIRTENLIKRLNLWMSLWRDVLLCMVKVPSEPINMDYLERIEQLAEQLDLTTARQLLTSLERTLQHLESNVNPRLAFESLFLEMPYLTERKQLL